VSIIFFKTLYSFSILGLSVFGLQALTLTALFLIHRRRSVPALPPPGAWPTVIVQLPVYNERHVVERLIDAAGALDYPVDRLTIQVLDDSTDETTARARARVAYYRARGRNIQLKHRDKRAGFKAGALVEGLETAPGEFIAVFDADFAPPPDFLKRLIPYFFAYPKAGMVQARWGHLNPDQSALTHAQALALDGHFVIEQTTRFRSGLLFSFNGSGGIWRRACIESVGGWQADTLVEDLDLSYRAQMNGWQLLYAPEVIVPAEVPPHLAAFKQQQFRWARGSVQALRKLLGALWTRPLTWPQRIGGTIHLSSYLAYVLLMLVLFSSTPLILMRQNLPPWLGTIALVGFAPPLMYAVSQWAAYRDWPKRLIYLPALFYLGIGVALNNAWAVVGAFLNLPLEFARTPKFGQAVQLDSEYVLRIDWTVWGEMILAIYTWMLAGLAAERAPGYMPLLIQLALGFSYVGGLGLWQASQVRPRSVIPEPELAGTSAPKLSQSNLSLDSVLVNADDAERKVF